MNDRILVVPLGNFSHERGLQIIGEAALDRILRVAKKEGRDIPIDFGHESFKKRGAEAAGWLILNSLVVGPEGLWAKIEWTKEAEESIRQRKYRYLSPVFAYNPRFSNGGKLHIERIVGLGLTNYPNISAMKPLFNQIQMEENMDELLTKLKEALGLSEEVESSEVLGSLTARLAELEPLQKEAVKIRSLLGFPEDVSTEEVIASLEKVSARSEEGVELPTLEEWEAMKEELAGLKEREIEERVNSAISSGKLLPAQRQWALSYAASDLEGFEAFLTNSRAVVQMGELVNAALRPAPEKLPLDEMQEKINHLLGISREVHELFNS